MAATQVNLLQLRSCRLVDFHTLQVVINLRVRQTQLILIGTAGHAVQQVSRRRLSPQTLRRTQNTQQQLVLALIQAVQRQQVRAAVTELREETRNGLRRMVGAHHQVAGAASNRVLGDHAGARLHITLVEVAHLFAGCVSVGGVETVDSLRNVEGQRAGGLDETQRLLRVLFVVLHTVGQAHRHELGGAATLVEAVHRQLAEATRQGGVDTAADAQYQAAASGGFQVVADELDAALHFFACLLFGHVGLDAHFTDDLCL